MADEKNLEDTITRLLALGDNHQQLFTFHSTSNQWVRMLILKQLLARHHYQLIERLNRRRRFAEEAQKPYRITVWDLCAAARRASPEHHGAIDRVLFSILKRNALLMKRISQRRLEEDPTADPYTKQDYLDGRRWRAFNYIKHTTPFPARFVCAMIGLDPKFALAQENKEDEDDEDEEDLAHVCQRKELDFFWMMPLLPSDFIDQLPYRKVVDMKKGWQTIRPALGRLLSTNLVGYLLSAL